MLLRLSIVNYALIRELDIEFGDAFSVITGETGAGKSIILGALSLILGQRADNLSLTDKSAKCSVEGVFDISSCDLESFFTDNDLDYDQTCIIRREITPQGKSRAFINDTPVNLNQLKELTGKLIDVHSQHQTLLLQESSFQLSVVDSVAGNAELLKTYKRIYNEINSLKSEMNALVLQNDKAKAEIDYLNFLFDELDKAALKPGEQEILEAESKIQNHAEEIIHKLFQVNEILHNHDDNIIRRLNEANSYLQSVKDFSPDIAECERRMGECLIELRDIASVIEHKAGEITYNPERIAELNERLSLIYQLEQKHRLTSVDELIALRNDIEDRINASDSLDLQIEQRKKLIEEKEVSLHQQALNLTEKRLAICGFIEKSLTETIAQLGMKDARFKVNIEPLPVAGRDGMDAVTFMFNANKGAELKELSKIASGGELSRLMLAVKSLISSSNLLPTIIFDEIDSGISGDIASKVGMILQKMAHKMQVIAISHLPQLAGKSMEHFKVLKHTDESSTWSDIIKLDEQQRIDELALMISGNATLESARETARELLRNNF